MEMKFTRSIRKFENVFTALFLAAIISTILATVDMLHLFPIGMAGALLPLIPQVKGKKIRYILLSVLSAFLLIRFASILDGAKLLANKMFSLSQQTQAYEYDYFTTTGENAIETVLWLSLLAGFLCSLWGNRFNSVLAAAWVIAMAYFGVTPGVFWLTALVLAALFNVLPGQQRWFHGIVVTVLVIAIAFAVVNIAPEPSKEVSALDEQLRDFLAAAPIEYEQIPVPTDVPEPEIVPPPMVEQEQPDHGVQPKLVNILFIVLATLTLVLLFVPAIIKDWASKRREKNRAGMNAEDHAQAIKAMYLYAQRWRSLSEQNVEIPADVYAVWQEAAYSDHAMTAAQREMIHCYMAETAKAVWAKSDWKKRLTIQYRVAL